MVTLKVGVQYMVFTIQTLDSICVALSIRDTPFVRELAFPCISYRQEQMYHVRLL